MVWVLTGTVQSQDDDPVGTIPAVTSHWLRPSRFYHLARAPIPLKPGAHTRTHLADFRIKAQGVSRPYAWKLELGDWTAADARDGPFSPSNHDAYSLTFTPIKSATLFRAGGGMGVQVQGPTVLSSGDKVTFGGTQPSREIFHFRVEWIPMVLCFSVSLTDRQMAQAQHLGIKLAKPPFLHHHTHFIPTKLSPTIPLCLAALFGARVVNAAFLQDLYDRSMLPPPPVDLPAPPEPGTDLSRADEDKLLSLALDGGADWTRYWRHSVLEANWEMGKPREEDFPVPAGSRYEGYTSEKWNPRPGRQQLFRNVLVISFRGGTGNPADESDSKLLKAGSGYFFATDLLANGASSRTILETIETFRAAENISPEVRIAIIAPADCEWTASRGEPPAAAVLRDVAFRLGVQNYIPSAAVISAIYEADTSPLFAPAEPLILAPPSAQSLQATPGNSASFDTVLGTHPEEETLFPAQRIGPIATVESAAPTVRKLTRRAKAGVPTSTLDDLFGTTRTQPAETASSLSLDTSRSDSEVVVSMDVDPVAPSSVLLEEPPRPRLKRRVGVTQQPESSLASVLEPSASESSRAAKKRRRDDDSAGGELRVVTEQDEHGSTRKNRAMSVQDDPEPSAKRTRGISQQPEELVDSAREKAALAARAREKEKEQEKGKKSDPTPSKGKRRGGDVKDGDDEGGRLLQMKTIKRKGGELDQAFNDEFNALRIVRPVLTKMTVPKQVRVDWDDEDPDLARERMILEEEGHPEHRKDWEERAKNGGGMFQVQHVHMLRRERPAPRNDLELEERYAGRANFKKFRPKNSPVARAPHQEKVRPLLVVSKNADFGLGAAYESQHKTKRAARDRMDESPNGTQTKVYFAKKPKDAKGKGKARAVVFDSEDDDVSATRREMNLSDDESITPIVTSERSKSKTAKKKPASPPQAARRAAPITLLIDESESSDDGLTFRGFGKTPGAGTKRKR